MPPTQVAQSAIFKAPSTLAHLPSGAYLDEACGSDTDLRRRVEPPSGPRRAGEFPRHPSRGRVRRLRGWSERGRPDRAGPHCATRVWNSWLLPTPGRSAGWDTTRYRRSSVSGMGVVLKAFDENLHRVVAVKVMAPQLAPVSPPARFTRRPGRRRVPTTTSSPSTPSRKRAACPTSACSSWTDVSPGSDRPQRPLPLREVLRSGCRRRRASRRANRVSFIATSSRNILLEERRRASQNATPTRAPTTPASTQSEWRRGRPSFMSPEQAESKSLDNCSGPVHLGSVLYAMCTGRRVRAGTTMGVLKRVCEETLDPGPRGGTSVPRLAGRDGRETAREDPAARFQSAAEVAELLGEHLARVHHPSVVPQPAVVRSAASPSAAIQSGGRGGHWAVAAAVVMALFAVLGTTEATVVTTIRATILRVFTPDGTLVVETDDPDVKVTVEGDGGLVITGAGLQEIRLKPGSYCVLADRNGKRVPLDRELVTVLRGGREIVRVKLEAPPAAPVAKAEAGAFVVLGGKGVAERRFDTLVEAVVSSNDGDIIEIRGNGPFVSDGAIVNHSLVIRAGTGFTPSILLNKESADRNVSLVAVNDRVVLEGLELIRTGCAVGPVEIVPQLILVWERGSLHVANCRPDLQGRFTSLGARLDIHLESRAAIRAIRY